MVGTPCWAASMTASPQPSLRDGSTCTQLRCSTCMFGVVVDVAVEGHGVGDAEPRRRGRRGARAHQPPPRTSRCRSGIRGRSRRSHPARPRSACAAPAATAPPPAASSTAARSGCSAGASSTPLRTTAMRSASTPSSARSRADGSDTVTYWLRRCSRGDSRDSTNQPIRLSTRPATGHCSRWQWCTSTTTRRPNDQPGQERQAVLGVDDDVGAHPAQRAEADPGRDHRQTRPDVDRVAAAAAADLRRRRRPRGAARPGSGRCAA